MKSKLSLFVLCFFMFNIIIKAQNQIYKQATISHPAELWKPLKLVNGTNVQDGVSFYVHNGECDSTKVKFIKIVNTNNYPVNFSYQLTKELPVFSVLVPAAVSIEGTCESNDTNLTKLVIFSLAKKTEAENKIAKEYILSHIQVSKI
jgi:hypothetical protein